MSATKNLLRISFSISFAIWRPAKPPCSIPIAIVILILNFSQEDISKTGFITCPLCSSWFIPSCFVWVGTSVIPHLGHLPGFFSFTSGCIGHVYIFSSILILLYYFWPKNAPRFIKRNHPRVFKDDFKTTINRKLQPCWTSTGEMTTPHIFHLLSFHLA